jgi:hypothetical protein
MIASACTSWYLFCGYGVYAFKKDLMPFLAVNRKQGIALAL